MNGPFIVIEGSDGSGKTTQFRLLCERLKAVGYAVDAYDFPRYEEPSAYFVKNYLNGAYGPASQVNPYTASMFYALDRFSAAEGIKKTIDSGRIALSNRFTGSNMAHQGAKFTSDAEQRGYFLWADSLEFHLLGIPRPNINIFLRVPAETSYGLIEKKARRTYTANKRDEHESDLAHLQKSVRTYDMLCRLFPKDYLAIDCAPGGKLLDIAAISDLIWEAIQPYLSERLERVKPGERLVNLNAPVGPDEPAYRVAQPARLARVGKGQILKDFSMLAVRELEANHCSLLSVKPIRGKNGKTTYFIPESDSVTLDGYRSAMDHIIAKREDILNKLKKAYPGGRYSEEIEYIAEQLLPLAALVSANVYYESKLLPQITASLNQGGNPELEKLSKHLKAPSEPKQRAIQVTRMKLPASHADESPPAQLISYLPRLEMDFLTDHIFAAQAAGNMELAESIGELEYDKKQQMLEAYLKSVTDMESTIPSLSYKWEIMADEPTLRRLSLAGCLTTGPAQAASPRNGYEVPGLLEQVGLDDSFIDCFDASLELYSMLQAKSMHYKAGYSVLAGHKSRWRVSTDYDQLANLSTYAKDSDAASGVRNVAGMMLEQVNAVHPTLYQHLISARPRRLSLQTEKTPSRKASAVKPKKSNKNRTELRAQAKKPK